MSYAHNVRNKRKRRERDGFNAVEVDPGQWELKITGDSHLVIGSESVAYQVWRIVTNRDAG